MSVIDERKSLAAESDLFDRLPASYRERPGALGALLGAVAASVRTFRGELDLTESRLGTQLAGDAFPAWVENLFDGEQLGSVRRERSHRLLPRTIDLCRWIARATGAEPRVWTGVRLERVGDDGGGTLNVRPVTTRRFAPQVRSEDSPRACVVAWWCERSDSLFRDELSRDELSRRLGNIPAELRPVGVELQCARFYGHIPSNPYVHGLCLQGELLQTWV